MGSFCSVPKESAGSPRSNRGLSSSLSSRWGRKSQSSARNSMHLHRASLSRRRSDRGLGSSDLFAQPHETSDIIFNSPLETSPLAEVDIRGNSRSERSSQALLFQEDSGTSTVSTSLRSASQKDSGTSAVSVSLRSASQKECGSSAVSASFESASQKVSENSEHGIRSRQSRQFQKPSKSRPCMSNPVSSHMLSRKTSDTSGIRTGSSRTRVPTDVESLQQRPGSNVDLLPRGTSKYTDSWTMNAFSELVESVQLEDASWPNIDISLDFLARMSQENIRQLGLPYIQGHSAAHSQGLLQVDNQAEAHKCALCTKIVSQRSPWTSHGILGSTEVPVVGILSCGHVFHAECLEQATPLMHTHDPPCPQCNAHEKARKVQKQSIIANTSKLQGNTEQTYVKGKLSRVCVATDDLTGPEFLSKSAHVSGKISSSPDTSSKGGSHSEKSILKRQFSLRGMLGRDPTLGNSGTKKPGSPARVSPGNNTGQNPPDKGGREGQLHALGYMKWR